MSHFNPIEGPRSSRAKKLLEDNAKLKRHIARSYLQYGIDYYKGDNKLIAGKLEKLKMGATLSPLGHGSKSFFDAGMVLFSNNSIAVPTSDFNLLHAAAHIPKL